MVGAAAAALTPTTLLASCAPSQGKKKGADTQLNLCFQEGVTPGDTLQEKLDFIESLGVTGFEVGGRGLAVRWIRAHAKELNLDADHIGTIGDSSGGHMAGFLGTTSNLKGLMMGDIGDNAEYSSSVQAVVDLFGPMNVLTMDQQAKDAAAEAGQGMMGHDTDGGPYSNYVGVPIHSTRETDPAPAQRADPGMYAHTLDPKTAPAFLIQHGTKDNVVPIGSSKEFAETVAKYIGKDKVIYEGAGFFDGAGHEDGRFFDEKNSKRVIEFLDKYLKPAKK